MLALLAGACASVPDPLFAPPPDPGTQAAARAALGLVPGSFGLPGGASLPVERRGAAPARWVLVGGSWLLPDTVPFLEGPLLALDGRARAGFGPEPGTTALAQDTRDLVRVLEAELAAGGEAPLLLAQGYHALVAALAARELGDRVGGLLLVAPLPARRDPHLARFAEEAARRLERAAFARVEGRMASGERSPEVAAELERVLLAPRFADPKLAPRVAADPYLVPAGEGAALRQQAERAIAELGDYDLRGELAGVTAPALVLHGGGDALSQESTAEFAAALAGAAFVKIARSGAFPWIERPAEFAAAVTRLERGGS
ncbi:MAG: hypothetical protein GC161_13235 [Planctomycetaceae bacterium]|nr:hypothetical protein [Planctomycetaceae bacterium]